MARRSRITHWLLVVFGGLCVGSSLGISGAVVTLIKVFLHGGVELLTEFVAADGIGYEEIYKWSLIIAAPIGVVGSIVLWRWAMCRIGLLGPDDYQ